MVSKSLMPSGLAGSTDLTVNALQSDHLAPESSNNSRGTLCVTTDNVEVYIVQLRAE
jgi:hypothetical protein